MTRPFSAALAAAAIVAAGGAAAQTAPSAGTNSGYAPRPLSADATRASENERDSRVTAERAVRESAERGRKSARERAVAASASDLVVGAEVRDLAGVPIGTIEAVDAGGVQIIADGHHAKVPADGFGKNRQGLLLNMTKAQFDAALAASGS